MNKITRKIVGTALSLFVSLGVSAQSVPLTGKTAPEIAKLMGTGWNLGNTLDATNGSGLGTETSWGNPKTTQGMIDEVKQAGFNTVRVPVSWGRHTSQSGDFRFKINDEWIARVKEVVDYCYKNDMFVILNIHHDNDKAYYYPSFSYQEQSETYVKDIWTQIAAAFADYDQHLIFETLNEPRLVGTSDEWWFDVDNPSNNVRNAIAIINDLNQIAVDAIRDNGSAYNKERMIMCPGYCASMEGCRSNLFKLPADKGEAKNRIALSVHAYNPYEFCLGSKSVTSLTANDKSGVNWMFSTLNSMYKSKGIAVVIGETSASNKNNLDNRLEWVDCFYGNSKKYGIPCVLWDNNIYANNGGEAHGYLNRAAQSWYQDGKIMVDKIMNTLGITPGTTGVSSANASLDVDLSVANDVLQVEAGCAVERISLFDISGNCVLEAQNCSSCSVSALNKGVYIVRIDTNIGSSVKKIVKK
jgi:aryl-phospho-beta-D-glucosidase BglC (GH1 family)